MPPPVKPPSPTGRISRAEQARRTRRRMLDAARALFVAQGYAATTMAQIGARAGVAVQTVHYTFKTKGTLLCELMDDAAAGDEPEPVPVQQRAWFREMQTTERAQRALAVAVEHSTDIYERASALWPAVTAASAADPVVEQYWRGVTTGRRRGQRAVVERLSGLHGLHPGLDVERGTDLLVVLNGLDVYRGLVVDGGWPLVDYKAWEFVTLVRDLLGATPDLEVAADLSYAEAVRRFAG